MNHTYQVGTILSNYRRMHHYTIKDLSEKTGLSTALISELERGIGNPTLSVLEILADTMGITAAALLEEEISNLSLVQRKADRVQTGMPYAKTLYDVLAVSPVQSKMELLLLDLEPGMCSNEKMSIHPYWEEIAYVISGTVVILFEQEEIELHDGDTIRILPGRGHMFANRTFEKALVLFARGSK